jgi:acetyl-CoA carboxylase carboxyltransferase component
MIEGGGLGVYSPEDVGPMSVQVPNGVVDVAVADEAEAVRAAKQYLSYFQGTLADWECEDQRLLRHLVPENRRRSTTYAKSSTPSPTPDRLSSSARSGAWE